jgi:branched-chain amino acid transport system permease protein
MPSAPNATAVSRSRSGNLGSSRASSGTFAAALLLGLANTAAIYLVPSMASVAFYIAMFLVLTLRPQGLFGRSA